MLRPYWQGAAVAACLMACSLGTIDPATIPGGLDRPVGGVQQLPSVNSIAVTPTSHAGSYFVTVRFSSPMSASSLIEGVYVAPAASDDGTAYSLGTPIEPDPTFGYHWDSTYAAVTMQFGVADVPIWRVVVREQAHDRFGAQLDGTSAGAISNAQNLARNADDGFAAAISHISLPYYSDPKAPLANHPHFRLNDDLPRAHLSVFAGDATVPWAQLDADNAVTLVTGTLDRVEVSLHTSNTRHAGDNQTERREDAYFHPTAISYVELRDGSNSIINVPWSFDQSGLLRGQSLAVTQVEADSQFVGLSGLGGHTWATSGALALVRGSGDGSSLLEYVQAITGGVLFPYFWNEGNGFGVSTEFVLRDVAHAWEGGQFVLQGFEGPVMDSPIVDNGGNYLVLADPIVGCEPSCHYGITYRPWVLLSPGQAVSLVSASIQADIHDVSLSEHPLPWRVILHGGTAGARDWRGLGVYDGVRDGDETVNKPDNTITWTLERPK